jgi:hypothetical protein
MLKRKQIHDAYLLSLLFWFAAVCAACLAIYLRFVNADVLTLMGVSLIYAAVFVLSFVSMKRARELARGLAIAGSIGSHPDRDAPARFSNASLPASEPPPRSTP